MSLLLSLRKSKLRHGKGVGLFQVHRGLQAVMETLNTCLRVAALEYIAQKHPRVSFLSSVRH